MKPLLCTRTLTRIFVRQREHQNFNIDAANLTETSTGKNVKVLNLSSRILSKHEMPVLLKGLKFTLKSNDEQLSNDIAEFHRKINLSIFLL